MEIGQKVIATKMAKDSFYKQVAGTLVGVRNGYALIEATRVVSKWDNEWRDHPTSCRTSALLSDVVAA